MLFNVNLPDVIVIFYKKNLQLKHNVNK